MSQIRKYTKEQLLCILNEKCPVALAQFPPPEAFNIKTNVRLGDNHPSVRVGYTMRKKTRKPKDILWLEEHTTYRSCSEYIAPGELRNDYMSLYYTTDDDVRVNAYIKNAKGFLGNDIFKKLTDSGIISAYSATMKAMFRFVLVHCGKATEYKEFENPRGENVGLALLLRGLKQLAKRNSRGTAVDGQGSAVTDAPEVFEPAQNNEKRVLEESEDDRDALTMNKKPRTD